MLVLSRKQNESIVIGNQTITITVVSIIGDRLKLGIEADRSIPVDRAEVHTRKAGKAA